VAEAPHDELDPAGTLSYRAQLSRRVAQPSRPSSHATTISY
jgi:hypothetical protein